MTEESKKIASSIPGSDAASATTTNTAPTHMPSLYYACVNAIQAENVNNLKPSQLMAIAYAETVGIPWFCSCSDLDKANERVVRTKLGEHFEEWKAKFTNREGIYRQKMARYRFEPAWYGLVSRSRDHDRLSEIDKVALSCSWGMCQKSAYYYTFGEKTEDKIPKLLHLLSSPALQLQVCAADLSHLLADADGYFALAATWYNRGERGHQVSAYGLKAARNAEQLEQNGCK